MSKNMQNDDVRARPGCESLLDVRDEHGGFAACGRDTEHAGMHAGAAPDGTTHQWNYADAWRYVPPVEREAEARLAAYEAFLPPQGVDVVVSYHDGVESLPYTYIGALINEQGIVGFRLSHPDREGFVFARAVDAIVWERTE